MDLSRLYSDVSEFNPALILEKIKSGEGVYRDYSFRHAIFEIAQYAFKDRPFDLAKFNLHFRPIIEVGNLEHPSVDMYRRKARELGVELKKWMKNAEEMEGPAGQELVSRLSKNEMLSGYKRSGKKTRGRPRKRRAISAPREKNVIDSGRRDESDPTDLVEGLRGIKDSGFDL